MDAAVVVSVPSIGSARMIDAAAELGDRGPYIDVQHGHLVQEEYLHIQEGLDLRMVESRKIKLGLESCVEIEELMDRARPHVRALDLDVRGGDASRSGRLRLDIVDEAVQEHRAEQETLTLAVP